MGLLVAVVCVEILIYLVYLPHAFLYWPIPAAAIYGMFWYMLDDAEVTGSRSWTALRNWSFWGPDGLTSVKYYWGEKTALTGERLVFVVVGNVTNMALISGFGLHGGVFSHLDICYLLPWPVFRVPLLREVLMWTGAISSGKNVNSAILGALQRGKSVCYAIDGMHSVLHEKGHPQHEVGEDLYEFAKREKIRLVPVLVEREHERYAIRQYAAHPYFLEMSGWPFPFVFGPRIFGDDPPPKLDVKVGVPMEIGNEDYQTFNSLFFNQITGVV